VKLKQIARAMESERYSPEVFVLLRDEAGNTKGVYRTRRLLPVVDEEGITGRVYLQAVTPNLYKREEQGRETEQKQESQKPKRERCVGMWKRIRDLFL
jgi:hypothetical protein